MIADLDMLKANDKRQSSSIYDRQVEIDELKKMMISFTNKLNQLKGNL